MKQKPVVIRTPMPTLEEFRRAIGMSKARAKRIKEIMDGSRKKPFQVMESKSKRRVVMTFAKVIQVVDEQIAEYRAAIAQLTAAKSTLAAEKKPSDPTPGEPTPVLRKRRFLSPQALKRISEAQKKRWAKVKRAKKAA